MPLYDDAGNPYDTPWEIAQKQADAQKAFKASGQDPFSAFTSKYRDLLYGAYGVDTNSGKGFNDDLGLLDPNTYYGQELSLGGGKGGRGKVAAQNAQYVQDMLHKLAPNLSQDQLDRFAWQALQNKQNEGKDYFTGTSGQGWHYASDLNDVVRDIGRAAGITDFSLLSANDQQMADRQRSVTKAAHKADDASSGVAGLLSDLGPASLLLNAIPGIGTALYAGLNGIAGAEQGNPLKAIAGAARAYFGYNNPMISADGSFNWTNPFSSDNSVALPTDKVSALNNPMLEGIDDISQLGYQNTGGFTYTPPIAGDGFQLDTNMLDPSNLSKYVPPADIPTSLTAHLTQTIPGTSSTWGNALESGSWSPNAEIPQESRNPLDDAKNIKKMMDGLNTIKNSLTEEQPQQGLLDSGSARAFSPLEVNYGFKPAMYGLLGR